MGIHQVQRRQPRIFSHGLHDQVRVFNYSKLATFLHLPSKLCAQICANFNISEINVAQVSE